MEKESTDCVPLKAQRADRPRYRAKSPMICRSSLAGVVCTLDAQLASLVHLGQRLSFATHATFKGETSSTYLSRSTHLPRCHEATIESSEETPRPTLNISGCFHTRPSLNFRLASPSRSFHPRPLRSSSTTPDSSVCSKKFSGPLQQQQQQQQQHVRLVQ